jgi:hypothetical protein|tara:strand:- start:576 stop:794 length:219 start_codon:yes stop_codon:yes gene_type:complete
MIRVILILLMLMQPSFGGCQYSATADVIDDKLVNKKEVYVCEEDKSFFVTFWTSPEWSQTATMTFLFLLENL